MAKVQNSSFYVRNEHKEGLLLVKNHYEKGRDILTIFSSIAQYAKDNSTSNKDTASLFKYLILYLKYLAQLNKDDIFIGEIEMLSEDTENLITPELYELIREIIEEE